MTIRLLMPFHLQKLAGVSGEISLEIGTPTLGGVLNAIEETYPVLRGTIRDYGTLKRRPFIRYFACKEDLSHEPASTPLPPAILNQTEPFLVIGAMAGG